MAVLYIILYSVHIQSVWTKEWFLRICASDVILWDPGPHRQSVKLNCGLVLIDIDINRPLCMRLPSCFKRNFVYCFRKLTVKRCLLTDSWDNHSRREGSLFNSCRLAFVMQCYARRHCHMQQYQRNLIAVVCNKWPRNFRIFLPDKIAGALQRWSRTLTPSRWSCCLATTLFPKKIKCVCWDTHTLFKCYTSTALLIALIWKSRITLFSA